MYVKPGFVNAASDSIAEFISY